MAQDFSFEPFFDDYSEDNNFHRILFRPGYAVQARELTQLQTILQEQIRRHGDHMFKEGSMIIPGQISYDLDLSYVQLVTNTGVDATLLLDSLVGKEIKNSAGLKAKVITYTASETVGGVFHPNTLFVKYLNSVSDNAGNNVQVFAPGGSLTLVDNSQNINVIVAGLDTIAGVAPVGKGCSATIQRGIYYIAKNFVLVDDQTIILDKYTNTPSYRVGLKLSEEISYPEEDESLLDNALGSPNYAAPGAARYKITLVLTKILENVAAGVDTGFIDLLRIRNGNLISKIDRTQYAEIEKTLARRTYDESGDYTVSPFGIQVKNYRNNLRGGWATGEKYIQGDLIKVSDGGVGSLYFVAITSGVAGSTQPTWTNYASVDNFTDNTIVWEYVAYPSFNNGVYTFTAGSTDFANFTLNDHTRLDGMLVYAIEAGKAYVRGYEIEKISTEYLPTEKSRLLPAGSAALCTYLGVQTLPAITDALSVAKTSSIELSMGSYINVNSVSYLPNLATLPQYKLHSVVKASATDDNLIGYARVRAIEKNAVSGEFKLFLFDIIMNVGKDFKDVKSVSALSSPSTNFSCNAIQTDSITVLQNPAQSGLIWDIPDYAVSQISEVSYSVVAPLTGTASASTLTLTVPTGYTFESVNDSDNYIVVNNATGSIVSSPTLAISGGNLVVSGLANQSHTVLATIRRSDATSAQALRTLTDATPIELKTQVAAQVNTITLNHSYVTRIVSVMMSTNAWGTTSPVYSVDITNRYSFDFAQDTSSMQLAKLNLLPNATLPIGPIIVKYEYLSSTENTQGDFLGVGSYTHTNSRLRYDQISTISNYPLRDSIDFRPYQVSGGNFQARYFPKYGTTGSFKYINHLSRLDMIALSSTGTFVVSRGIPSERPFDPSIPTNCMKLAQVSLEPYTFERAGKIGVAINRIENKRYTMRDIGKLERRIVDLEYYTSLSLTELDTKNLRITDSLGFERFQNGFLVDAFDGQGVGNSASDDWNASIDIQRKELRPFFDQKHVNLLEKIDSTYAGLPEASRYKVSGDIVTLPFTETALLIQNKASITENVNPYALYSWTGIVDINPWSDTWFSTHYRPDIVLNDESQYNAIIAKAEADGILGTIWNSWQVAFSSSKSLSTRMENLGVWSEANTEILNASNNGGSFWRATSTFTAEEAAFVNTTAAQAGGVFGSRVVTIETSAVETTSTRVGTRSFAVDKVDSRVVDDRIVDTQIVPYIRPRAVLFTGYGFKPATRMFASFDNVLVNDYITPAVRLEVTPIAQSGGALYPFKFDVTRNAGSAVSTKVARFVNYNDGATVSGTVDLTNGSTTVTGTSTAFTQQVEVGDFLNIGTSVNYKVVSIASNTSLTVTPAYTGTTVSGVSIKVIGPRHNTDEVEIAFNHGEIRTEVGGNGNTAIVVGQEVVGTKYYIYVLNIKGTGSFSTSSDAYLEGEYLVGTLKPRVKFVARTNYSSLTTSETGLLNGIFRVPSNPILKFRTGTRELRFSDSAITTPTLRAAQESTSGGAFYEAKGLIEVKQRTIISTRTANIVSEQVSGTNTIVTTNDRLTRDTGWYDPLAQTFLIQQEGGAFVTSVDLFFSNRDENIPVRVEIREVVNGYPGATVVPFSRVEKKAKEVNVNPTDGTTVTNFKFVSPVFLQNGVEYALTVLSDSNNYRMWISQTDTVDVVTGARISSQPYNGVLFKSQNGSAWTADQTQDMKFTLYRAQFTQTPVTIELIPPKLAYKDLGFNPLNFIAGSRKCRVEHRNHGMITGEYVILKTRQIIESINGINKQYIFNTPLQILSAELDSYVVQFGGTVDSTATGKVGGGFITASENYEFSTAMVEIGEVIPEGTSISYEAKVINHADQISTYKIIPKENTTLEEVKVYPSEANYTNSAFPSGLSIIATLMPSSSLNSVSPVIDLNRLGMTLVSNKIDSPNMDINDVTLDYIAVAPTGIEIGAGKPIVLLTGNTLVINSTAQPTLYTNMNNNLNVGDVLRFTYSGITDAVRNMIIVEKSLDTSGNLYLLVEGFSGETLSETTTGQTTTIYWLSHFKGEYAPIGGSTHSKYVTKKINFSRPSEMLKIMFDAIIPNDADVEIYYKTGLGASGDFIASRYYKATPSSYPKNSTDFKSIVVDVEGLSSFDSVMIKLVMKSINKSQVPRIKNFRVIACAA